MVRGPVLGAGLWSTVDRTCGPGPVGERIRLLGLFPCGTERQRERRRRRREKGETPEKETTGGGEIPAETAGQSSEGGAARLLELGGARREEHVGGRESGRRRKMEAAPQRAGRSGFTAGRRGRRRRRWLGRRVGAAHTGADGRRADQLRCGARTVAERRGVSQQPARAGAHGGSACGRGQDGSTRCGPSGDERLAVRLDSAGDAAEGHSADGGVALRWRNDGGVTREARVGGGATRSAARTAAVLGGGRARGRGSWRGWRARKGGGRPGR
ncbi:glycine-rich cell wall structural protein 1.0-like [Phragmites australis]|uniref:glycine-rich cell wall structural protein 1.0-like n=1 Tax=Phragmites australis TaxID=29695 RepID=UPI002D7812A0|nr:glycine-rich cell wall structural protein 1.0-like [Phragmites australis]